MSYVSASAAGSRSPARTRQVTATLAVAFAAPFVSSLANAIPGSLNGVFQQYFKTQGSELTWITAAFLIPVVVFELTFGAVGDIYGRKRLMYLGSALLAVGSLLTVFAPTVQQVWVGAALNGLGAGILYPTSLAMISAITHGRRARTRAIAVWAGFLSLGAAICPLIAGLLADAGWWQGGYVLIAVVAAVTLLLAIPAKDSSAPEGRKLDIPGQITFAVGLIAVLWATVQGADSGYNQPYIIAGWVLGGALLIAFLFIESRASSPILHLDLFKNRLFSVVGLVTVIGVFGSLVYYFSTSVWLGVLQHQNAMNIGLVWIVSSAPAFVLSPFIGRILHVVNPKWLLGLGFALIAASMYISATFDPHNYNWTIFFFPAAVFGVGWALALASLSVVSLNTVPPHLAGMGSATTNLLRDLGFALGPTIGGAIAFGTANSKLFPALAALNLPPEQAGPVMGVAQAGGAVAVNSVPAFPLQVHEVALTALGQGFQLAYLVGAIAATVAALVTVLALIGVKSSHENAAESISDASDPGRVAATVGGE